MGVPFTSTVESSTEVVVRLRAERFEPVYVATVPAPVLRVLAVIVYVSAVSPPRSSTVSSRRPKFLYSR